MKVIKPVTHAVLDYALAALFLVMPALLEFGETAGRLSFAVGAAYVLVSLLTRYPLGLVKLIPFKVHGVLEAIMAAGWIIAPWLFGFADDTAARNFFVAAGIGLLAVVALTDYRAVATGMPSAERRSGLGDRRREAVNVGFERRSGIDRRGGLYAGT